MNWICSTLSSSLVLTNLPTIEGEYLANNLTGTFLLRGGRGKLARESVASRRLKSDETGERTGHREQRTG